MTKAQALKGRIKVYKKMPQHLNQLGFEMALFINFNYEPSREALKDFYQEYDKVRGK